MVMSLTLLWQGLLKFMSDITISVCMLYSQFNIKTSYSDVTAKFYALTDLFNYNFVFSLSKVIPDAFISVTALVDAVLMS